LRHTGNASTIRDALEEAFTHLDIRARVRESLLPYLWGELMGPLIGKVSRVRLVRGETLYVDAETPSWATTLSMQSQDLIRKINSYFGEKVISEIHVSGKGFAPTAARRQRKREPAPREEELEAVELPSAQVSSLRAQWQAVSDAHLRRLLEMTSVRRAKLEVWRLEHGWKRCAACNSVFRARGKTCQQCRKTSNKEKTTWRDTRES